jgi:hypothetical protein
MTVYNGYQVISVTVLDVGNPAGQGFGGISPLQNGISTRELLNKAGDDVVDICETGFLSGDFHENLAIHRATILVLPESAPAYMPILRVLTS